MERFTIKKTNLNEQVANIIKERINSMDFMPGDRLIVDMLAKEINVSMTPVREGLRNLVFEGLVNYDGKKYSVFNPTRRDAKELLQIREGLEKVAAYQAAINMTDFEIDKLRTEYIKSTEKLGKATIRDFLDSDMLLHNAIRIGSRNSRLIDLLKPFQEQYWLLRRWIFESDYSIIIVNNTVSEHIELIDAIAAHNPKLASSVIDKHLERTIREITEHGLSKMWGESPDSRISIALSK